MVQWVSVKILVQSGCLMLKLTIPIKVRAQNHQTQTSFSSNCPLNKMLPLYHVTIKCSSCANRSDLRDGGWASEGMLADYKSIWTSHLYSWIHTQTSLHHLSAHLQGHRPRHPSGRIYILSIKDPFQNVHKQIMTHVTHDLFSHTLSGHANPRGFSRFSPEPRRISYCGACRRNQDHQFPPRQELYRFTTSPTAHR